MKKLTALLASLLMLSNLCMSALPVFAEVIPDEPGMVTPSYEEITIGDFVCRLYVGHTELLRCTSDAAEVVIPKEMGNRPVTTIGDNAFSSCTALTSLVIPDTVNEISMTAFDGAPLQKIFLEDDAYFSNLENYLPHSAVIYDYFHDYDGTGEYTMGFLNGMSYAKYSDHVEIREMDYMLSEIVVPAQIEGLPVTRFAAPIRNDLVGGTPTNWTLEKITIPATVTAFSLANCVGLKEIILDENNPEWTTLDGVLFNKDMTLLKQYPIGREADSYTIPETVTEIASSAFSQSTLKSVIFPDGLTAIGGSAFSECDGLTEIILPDSVTTVGDDAFSRCDTLTRVHLSEGLTKINKTMFIFCPKLSEVNFPEALTEIGEAAFYGTALTEAVIPEQVTKLADNVFTGCTELVRAEIPAAAAELGKYVFSGCTKLTGIYVDADNPSYCDLDGVLLTKDMTTILEYPDSYPAKHYTIPACVTTIGGQAFTDTVTLESIVIPETVTKIGNLAFQDSPNLRSAVILADTDTIGQYTFSGCKSLAEITLTDRVRLVEFRAFTGVAEQTEVYYLGSEASWDSMEIEHSNEGLTEGNVHFNSVYAPAANGDLNGDDRVDSSDAAALLLAAANEGVTGVSELTAAQKSAADLNADGTCNAADAAVILHYAAYLGTGGTLGIGEFLEEILK